MNLLDRARVSRVRCLALAAQARAGAPPTRGQVIRCLAPISDELASVLAGLAPWEAAAGAAGSCADGGGSASAASGLAAVAIARVRRAFAVEAAAATTPKIGDELPSG
jgi:hypothetical protein